jgi:hypothetical protein
LHFEASWSVFLGLSPQVVHEMQGVLVYVSFLLAFYFLLGFVISRSLRTLFLSKYLYKNGFFSFILLEKYN